MSSETFIRIVGAVILIIALITLFSIPRKK
jgi:hypothetical protein